ncbi:MAG: hypothetical protein LLG37_10355 [Spirochaetia bacterium]|nr:hypothetical protein [Spirochaetia bacterium]
MNIRYSGSATDPETVAAIIDEFADISRISGWKYEMVRENFQTFTAGERDDRSNTDEEGTVRPLSLSSSDVYLDGLMITINPDWEPLKLTFDRNHKMANIAFSKTDTPGFSKKITIKKYEFLYYPYIKMMTRNAENHIQAVKLLRYLKFRYIHDLKVLDPSMFWDTADIEALNVKFWREAEDQKNLKPEL